MTETDPLKPSPTILVNLGSIAVHIEEMVDEDFKNLKFDLPAIQTALADSEVQAWLKEMQGMALVPLKRKAK